MRRRSTRPSRWPGSTSTNRTHFVASTVLEHELTGRFEAGSEAVFSFSFENLLGPAATSCPSSWPATATAPTCSTDGSASSPWSSPVREPQGVWWHSRTTWPSSASGRRRRSRHPGIRGEYLDGGDPRSRQPIRRPSALGRRLSALRAPDLDAGGTRSSSCASSARRSATCGSSCARCCCSGCSTSCSRRSSGSAPTCRIYPVVLLTNIVLFTFFAEATSGAVTLASSTARAWCARSLSRDWSIPWPSCSRACSTSG